MNYTEIEKATTNSNLSLEDFSTAIWIKLTSFPKFNRKLGVELKNYYGQNPIILKTFGSLNFA